MSQKLSPLREQISSLIKTHSYNELNDLFIQNQLDFEEYCYVLTRKQTGNKDLNLNMKFWQSEFSSIFIDNILHSGYCFSFFRSFFYNEKHYNETLLKKVNQENTPRLIEQLKLHQSFKYENVISFLTQHQDTQLRNLATEFKCIKEVYELTTEEVQKHYSQLTPYSPIKVLILFSTWKHPQNYRLSTQEPGTASSLIAIINKYLRTINYSSINKDLTTEDVKKIQNTIVINDNASKQISSLITNLYDASQKLYAIELYACGYLDLESINNENCIFKSNKTYSQYQFNDAKVKIFERYLRLKPNGNPKEPIEYYMDFINFHGKQQNVFKDKYGLNLRDVFKVIRSTVETLKGPYRIWDFNDFKRNIGNHVRHLKNIDSITEYLTIDLCEFTTNEKLEFPHCPFIKIGNVVITLNSFLIGRSWEVILLNRLIKELPSFDTGIAYENSVNKCFSPMEFTTTLKRNEIETKSGAKTDIDILQYHSKSKTLFVGQVKFSRITEDFSFISYLQYKRLVGDASIQMDISLQWIEENWNYNKKNATISISDELQAKIPFEEVNIVPIIITNYFDGDGKLYHEIYPKISQVQLDAIFKNRINELDICTPLSEFIRHKVERYRNRFIATPQRYPKILRDNQYLTDMWHNNGSFDGSICFELSFHQKD